MTYHYWKNESEWNDQDSNFFLNSVYYSIEELEALVKNIVSKPFSKIVRAAESYAEPVYWDEERNTSCSTDDILDNQAINKIRNTEMISLIKEELDAMTALAFRKISALCV